MKKVGIIQSNYIPWKGYFDFINSVDEFILYDNVQYTRRDWRNRNKIMTPQGAQWLSIPVEVKGKYSQSINETKVADHEWIDKHWKALKLNYAHAQYFNDYADIIQAVYEDCRNEDYLSKINYKFLKSLCEILNIKTKISWSTDYKIIDGKTERLAALVKEAGGDFYLSGPAAQCYIEEDIFKAYGIELDWMKYDGYPEYHQASDIFEHSVTVLDLIFNEGPNARKYMLSTKDMPS